MFDIGNVRLLLGFLLLAGVLVSFVGSAVFLVVRALARNTGGDLKGLVARYPAENVPLDGYHFAERRTVQAGRVAIKRCATIGVGPGGLFLRAPWRAPALIPWSEIRAVQPTELYWRDAVSLVVGDPTIARLTFFAEDFGAMRGYLNQPRDHERLAVSTAAER